MSSTAAPFCSPPHQARKWWSECFWQCCLGNQKFLCQIAHNRGAMNVCTVHLGSASSIGDSITDMLNGRTSINGTSVFTAQIGVGTHLSVEPAALTRGPICVEKCAERQRHHPAQPVHHESTSVPRKHPGRATFPSLQTAPGIESSHGSLPIKELHPLSTGR